MLWVDIYSYTQCIIHRQGTEQVCTNNQSSVHQFLILINTIPANTHHRGSFRTPLIQSGWCNCTSRRIANEVESFHIEENDLSKHVLGVISNQNSGSIWKPVAFHQTWLHGYLGWNIVNFQRPFSFANLSNARLAHSKKTTEPSLVGFWIRSQGAWC